MDDEAWISEEPRPVTLVLRVLARAARRPLLVLLVTLLGAGMLVAQRVLRPPTYVATISFRLAEGDVSDPNAGPRPPRALREYIENVALSRARLQQIMRAHRWSSPFLALEPVKAVEEFRDEIRIDVSRNYFIYDRASHDAPRSAQVSISFSGTDAKKTREVLHDIGEVILQEQAEHRNDRLLQARQLADGQLGQARARVKSLQSKIADLRRDAAQGGSLGFPAASAQVGTLVVESRVATEQVLALERRRSELEFIATAESANLGLSFERYDERLVAASQPLTPWQVVRLAAAIFATVLALVVPVVGAFNDRIYSTGDLVAHGLPVFGDVGRFPGDDAGAFCTRTNRTGV